MKNVKFTLCIIAASMMMVLGGCTTTKVISPTSSKIGEIGKTSNSNKMGVVAGIYAPTSLKCFVNDEEATKIGENGEYRYITANKGDVRHVSCNYPDGTTYSRDVNKLFDEKTWRNMRTFNFFYMGIATGGIGFLAAPVTSEMNKWQYKIFPAIIHMPTPGLSKEQAIEEKFMATKHWDESVYNNCEGKQKCIEVSKSPFFYELRNEDLKIFDEVSK